MAEMGIGEIGVLQNLESEPGNKARFNGELVEITGVIDKGDLLALEEHGLSRIMYDGYRVKFLIRQGGEYTAKKHQVRKLNDPDATESIEHDEEVEA